MTADSFLFSPLSRPLPPFSLSFFLSFFFFFFFSPLFLFFFFFFYGYTENTLCSCTKGFN